MPFNQKPQKFNAKINTVTVGTGDKMRLLLEEILHFLSIHLTHQPRTARKSV